MTLLQFGIGAVNDVIDAPRDAGRKALKPIPAGLVRPAWARTVAAASFLGGVALAALAGPEILALSVVVAAIGLAYDLALKGTAWSWLPFAVGIPLLPVYGWLGAAGTLPDLFGILVPVAIAAGAALAVANSLVDVERDRAAGVGSIAASLGVGRAWMLGAGLVLSIVLVATASSGAIHGATAAVIVGAAGLVPIGATVIGWRANPARRERAWQLEAVGLGLLAVVWLGIMSR
jgi:4-hydroxybenzoate polyprenyltransferase